MKSTCYYHRNRESNQQCDGCGEIICSDCVRTYKQIEKNNSSQHYIFIEKCGMVKTFSNEKLRQNIYKYCPRCYYDIRIKEYSRILSFGDLKYISLSVFLVSLGFLIFFIAINGEGLYIIPIPFLFLSLILFMGQEIGSYFLNKLYRPKKIRFLLEQKEKFLRKVKN